MDADGPVRVVDLAAELGLSPATVSRALNGSELIRPEVAERVHDHAVRRGYVPNRLARSLRARARTFVGFLAPDIENLAYSISANTCARSVSEAGYQLILAISADDPETEFRALRDLSESQPAALIIAASPEMNEQAHALLHGTNIVEFNRDAGLAENSVVCADREAFERATRHLLALGHRRIGYIGTSTTVSNGNERYQGLRGALHGTTATLAPEHTRTLPPTESHGYTAVLELLNTPEPPTAVLVGGSSLSLGVARALRESAVALPDDLSLIVYGDPRWGELHSPPLTTISVPYQAMARRAAEHVIGLLHHDPPHKCRARFEAELVMGRSTEAPPNRQTTGGLHAHHQDHHD